MIIIKIMGGLGNQMFQYSLAKAFMSKGREVKFDLSYFDNIPSTDTHRKLELEKFGIKLEKATQREIDKYINGFNTIYNAFAKRINPKYSKCIMENLYQYIPELLEWDNKYLVGYWQNEKYFYDIREELIKEFDFSKINLSYKNKEILDEVSKDTSCAAIHVRGGDYLNNINASTYGNICTNEYYHKACEYLENKYGINKYYLFTNDLEWVKNSIFLDWKKVKTVNWNTEDDGIIDMYLMSRCSHNIIANSSFSWWGAWLNKYSDKVVIAPDKWENNCINNSVIPENWLKIG